MDFSQVEWWHWVVLGCALLAADVLLINIYYIIWFGIGALVAGGVLAVVPLPFSVQIVLWGALSALLLLQWLFWLRPRFDGKRAAEARKQLPGQAGVVVRFNNGAGELRLQRPVGGRDVWEFTSNKERKPGDRVVIAGVDEKGTAAADDNNNGGGGDSNNGNKE